MTDFYRIRNGHHYCIRDRDADHRLVETGEFSDEGKALVDGKIDHGNPAASIPITLEGGAPGPQF